MPSNRYLIMVSNTAQTCGVEEFSRILASRLGRRGRRHELGMDLSGLRRELREADAIVMNFPVVAWKKKLLAPIFAALVSRLDGKEVVVILHEWASLDWKRRMVLAPVILLATGLCFSAPEISEEFAGSALFRLTTGNRTIIPIPPNFAPPAQVRFGEFSERLREERARGRLILGQFGSIYPQKQVTSVLSVAAELLKRGEDVFVAFAGSFIKGQDTIEQDFARAVNELGLSDRVAVSGFISDKEELFAIFREIDIFCYLLPGGLTARRGSVLAAAASGKPVVVNAPTNEKALAHHSLFQRLIENGCVQLFPTDGGIPAAADAVLAARRKATIPTDIDGEVTLLWDNVLARIDSRTANAGSRPTLS